jgi:hypothetical protein
MKIRPVGAELFYADEQKDRREEANSRFSRLFKTRLKCYSEYNNYIFHKEELITSDLQSIQAFDLAFDN